MRSFKKCYVLVVAVAITLLFCLVGCTPTDAPKDADDSSSTGKVMPLGGPYEIDSSKTKISIGEYQEEMARYYTTDITTTENSAVASKISVANAAYEDTAVLQAATEEERQELKDLLPTMGKFMEVAEESNETGLQMHSETADNEMLSYVYFLDGGVQMTYVSQWSATDDLSEVADEMAQDVVDYIGLDVSGEDLKNVHNLLTEAASSGQYSFVITDPEAMDGFYMSVVGYGTEEASWQLYAQRYILSDAAVTPEG